MFVWSRKQTDELLVCACLMITLGLIELIGGTLSDWTGVRTERERQKMTKGGEQSDAVTQGKKCSRTSCPNAVAAL